MINIVTATVTATIGVWIASCALIGYMFQPLSRAVRILMFVSGVLLLLPGHTPELPHGELLNVIGFLVGAFLVSKDYLARKRSRPVTQPAGE